MKEAPIVKKILAWLNEQPDCWATKIHGNEFVAVGTPDIIGFCCGRFFAFEVKAPGRGPSKIQRHRMEEISSKGGCVGVVRDLEVVREVVENIRRDFCLH